MGDIAALQKQLEQKLNTIKDLEKKKTAREETLLELEDDVDRKARNIYYLERNCDARDREIGDLRGQIMRLEAKAAKETFGPKVDEAINSVKAEAAKVEQARVDYKQKKISRDSAKILLERYEKMILKIGGGATPEQVVAMLQEELNSMAQEMAEQKSKVEAYAQGVKDQKDLYEEAIARSRFLDQYRVDSIFRVFTIKAEIKIIKTKLEKLGVAM